MKLMFCLIKSNAKMYFFEVFEYKLTGQICVKAPKLSFFF